MKTVLQIGYDRFLLSQAQANAVLLAMSKAIPLERKWDAKTHRDLFWPSTKTIDMKLELVPEDAISHIEPADVELPTGNAPQNPIKRLNGTRTPLLLLNS